jgi:class 3 adenylate cyclase/pimeloyl-ACP methyl ester carboxylesterase
LKELGEGSRLILHDRRATGLSSRNVAVPNLETRVTDLQLVLDAAVATRPVLAGFREGGSPNLIFAATYPERVRSLVWYAPSARSVWTPDYPWGVRPEYVEAEQRSLDAWGTSEFGRQFLEVEASGGHRVPPYMAEHIARLSRHTATPDIVKELSRVWYDSDVRDVLPAVRVPVLLCVFERDEADVAETTYLASLMPDAKFVVMPGGEEDGDFTSFVDAIRSFLGIDRVPDLDTVLSTVLFTDIVGSTQRQAALGDRSWRDLVLSHHAVVREGLKRWRGVENDTAGDGFYATFDGPARAIRCAMEVSERVRDLGIEIRAGVHTGECEIVDGKRIGLSVSIGARVMGRAGASEVLVSQTVKDLTAGSGFTFEDRGEHDLKGVPDRWHLFRVSS